MRNISRQNRIFIFAKKLESRLEYSITSLECRALVDVSLGLTVIWNTFVLNSKFWGRTDIKKSAKNA